MNKEQYHYFEDGELSPRQEMQLLFQSIHEMPINPDARQQFIQTQHQSGTELSPETCGIMFDALIRFRKKISTESLKERLLGLKQLYSSPRNFFEDPDIKMLSNYRDVSLKSLGEKSDQQPYICSTLEGHPLLGTCLKLGSLYPALFVSCIEPTILSGEAEKIRNQISGERISTESLSVRQIIEYFLNNNIKQISPYKIFSDKQSKLTKVIVLALINLDHLEYEKNLSAVEREIIKDEIKSLRPGKLRSFMSRQPKLSDEQIKQAILKKLRLRTCDAYEHEISMLILMGESLQQELFGLDKLKGLRVDELGDENTPTDLFE